MTASQSDMGTRVGVVAEPCGALACADGRVFVYAQSGLPIAGRRRAWAARSGGPNATQVAAAISREEFRV
jgi:hypothetical protein